MQILTPFVEGIYYTNLSNLQIHNTYFCKKIEHLYENNTPTQNYWRCDTYNHNIPQNDPFFEKCLDTFYEHLKKFIINYTPKINFLRCQSAWLNLSRPNSFQEYHIHPKSHFSAVYYIKVPEKSGNIVFKKEGWNNMFEFDVLNFNKFNQSTYFIQPKECDFLIFKSDLQHMVEKNMSVENRVSLSINFTIHD